MWIGGFYLFHGGGASDKREPKSCVPAKVPVIRRDFFTLVLLYGSYRIMVDLIYFVWGRGTHDNRTPEKSCARKVTSYDSHCRIVDFIYFMEETPFINVNHKIGARKGTYQAALYFKSILSKGS